MSVRLNKFMRSNIVDKAVDATFKDREEELQKQKEALGDKVYDFIFSKAELYPLQFVDKKWLKYDDNFYVINKIGHKIDLHTSEPKVMPYSERYWEPVGKVLDNDLCSEHNDLLVKQDKLHTERTELTWKLRNMLRSISTLKQLKEYWPEGSKFYEQYDVTKPKENLPAPIFDTINKLMGLTK